VVARHAACTGAGKAGARPRGRERGGAGLGRLRLMGQKRGRRPQTVFFLFKQPGSSTILTILKAFSEDDAKMKVVPFCLLYKFALRVKP
jgi:hypothetical protein